MARHVRLTRRGPAPVSTPEQVEQVLGLAREGRSLRSIAETVYGSARLKDRVGRLLRQTYELDERETDVVAALAGLDRGALEELVGRDRAGD